VVYAPTAAGEAALDAWLRATGAPPEPIRADLHLRIAFAREEHRAALAAQLAADERACEELLACYPRPSAGAGAALLDDAVVTRLRAELAWLARARAAIADDEG
jgi:hypothetical protein